MLPWPAQVSVSAADMPDGFAANRLLVVEKMDAESVNIGDYASKRMETEVKGGAMAGLQMGTMVSIMFPPAIVALPIFAMAGGAMGAVAGGVVGAGEGVVAQANNNTAAKNWERRTLHDFWLGSICQGAAEEMALLGQEGKLETLVPTGADVANPLPYVLRIELREVGVREQPAKHEGEGELTAVYFRSTAQLHQGSRTIWRAQFQSSFVLPDGVGDLQPVTKEALNPLVLQHTAKAGRDLAHLAAQAIGEIPYGESQEFTATRSELPRITGSGISDKDGDGMKHTVFRGASEPLPHSGVAK
jgi:hypothetical protein